MNKKILFGAALIGLMGFASCVDDTESASVTAVRQAKAEQIKSLSALNDANAQAALITANASKVAQEAQAAYYQAQAEELAARKALLEAQTESAKAAAEEALARAEVEKQKAANDLQLLAGQLELELTQQKQQILQAQTAYENAIQANKDAEKAKLNSLLSEYKYAQDELFGVQKLLAQNEIELAKTKAGLTSAESVYQFQISQLQTQITDLEEDNLKYQAYIDTWKDYTKAEAQEAIDKAYQEKLALDIEVKEADQAKVDALSEKNLAMNTLENSDYVQAVKELIPYSIDGIRYFGNVQVKWVDEYTDGAPIEARNKYCGYIKEVVYTWDEINWTSVERVLSETYIPLFTNNQPTEQEKLEYQLNYYYGGSTMGEAYTTYESYDVYTQYYDLVDGSLDKFITAVKESQTINSEILEYWNKVYDQAVKEQADAQKAYDDALAAQNTYEDAITAREDAQKVVDDAQKVVDEAGDKVTEAQTKALEEAKADLEKKEEAERKALEASEEAGKPWDKEPILTEAKAYTAEATKYKNSYEYYVSKDAELIADLNADKETLTSGTATNKANIEAVNEANLAYAEAVKTANLTANERDQKTAEYNALTDIVAWDSNNQHIESTIENYTNNIKYNNERIASLNNSIEQFNKEIASDKYTVDTAISNLEQEIAKQKAEIEVLQTKVDIAKAALDEAMENAE